MRQSSDDRERLARICSALVEAFESHPETLPTDQCSITVEGGGVMVIDHDDPPATGGMWTAQQVADHYGVSREFAYEHANELGVFRLGSSARPRLRFDPDVVRERLAAETTDEPVVEAEPAPRPGLIPIKGDPWLGPRRRGG
jgi:hypothetical protein